MKKIIIGETSWVCPKCKTENSYNTDTCVNCHSINHSIKAKKEIVADSTLFKNRPADNSFIEESTEFKNRKANAVKWKCSECGEIYSSDAGYCTSCGAKAHTTYIEPHSYSYSTKSNAGLIKKIIFGIIGGCIGGYGAYNLVALFLKK